MTWADAKAYCETLESRLPTLEELAALHTALGSTPSATRTCRCL